MSSNDRLCMERLLFVNYCNNDYFKSYESDLDAAVSLTCVVSLLNFIIPALNFVARMSFDNLTM